MTATARKHRDWSVLRIYCSRSSVTISFSLTSTCSRGYIPTQPHSFLNIMVWSAPGPLVAIADYPLEYTHTRDQLIKTCVKWRHNFIGYTEGLFRSRTPGRGDKLGRLEKERMHLLVQADTLAMKLSQECGAVHAVRTIYAVRHCLALDNADLGSLLTFWNPRPTYVR